MFFLAQIGFFVALTVIGTPMRCLALVPVVWFLIGRHRVAGAATEFLDRTWKKNEMNVLCVEFGVRTKGVLVHVILVRVKVRIKVRFNSS